MDPVTGVATRDFLHERLEREWPKALRERRRVTLLMLSLDHNRGCGSEALLQCKQLVSEVIGAHCRRRADLLAQLRDHEFAILLSDATRQGAQAIATSICRAVAQHKFQPAGTDWLLTVSMGIGSLVPRRTRSAEDLLVAADAGLRKARRMGGNTVQSSTKLR